jgi:hypothetical protein
MADVEVDQLLVRDSFAELPLDNPQEMSRRLA